MIDFSSQTIRLIIIESTDLKQYPSIPRQILSIPNTYAFDKLDGSNIRAEWSRKNGFYKYGSRTRLIDAGDGYLGRSISLILEKYSDGLNKIFTDMRVERSISYFEFWGEKSFAGNHDPEDKTMTVTLIDVDIYKKGILPPKEFIKKFEHLGIASPLYFGNINDDVVKSVKTSTLEGMTFEGIVCKTLYRNTITMFKVKSQAWIDKLKIKCNGNEELFNALL